jgi:hypothetical protein
MGRLVVSGQSSGGLMWSPSAPAVSILIPLEAAAKGAFAYAEHAGCFLLSESVFVPEGQGIFRVHFPDLL